MYGSVPIHSDLTVLRFDLIKDLIKVFEKCLCESNVQGIWGVTAFIATIPDRCHNFDLVNSFPFTLELVRRKENLYLGLSSLAGKIKYILVS